MIKKIFSSLFVALAFVFLWTNAFATWNNQNTQKTSSITKNNIKSKISSKQSWLDEKTSKKEEKSNNQNNKENKEWKNKSEDNKNKDQNNTTDTKNNIDNKDDKKEDIICEEWDEECEKQKKAKWREVKMPQELLDLYKEIETKYWWTSIHAELKTKDKTIKKEVNNWEMYFWLAWMKDLKDWIKSIDNNVKIDYIMSKMMNFELWKIWWSWWLTKWEHSLYTYTTYWYYKRTVSTIKNIMIMKWDTSSTQRLEEVANQYDALIRLLLELWFWSSIWRNESESSFSPYKASDTHALHASARNWWFFQIYKWCNPIWWNAIEENTWQRIYVSWKSIWWQHVVYWWNSHYHLKANPADIMCLNRFWLQAADWTMTDDKYLLLWMVYKTVDQERYNYIKAELWWDENITLIYLWKEIQYMYQFYNFVSFLANKIQFSLDFLANKSVNWIWSIEWINWALSRYWLSFTKEQIKYDYELLSKCVQSEWWCSSVQFQWYNTNNKALFNKVWITNQDWYVNFLAFVMSSILWWYYNWTWNFWNNLIDNAYVSNPWWAWPMLFWKEITATTCRYWWDWKWFWCKAWWSIWIWMSTLFYIRNMKWQNVNNNMLDFLLMLQNNWQFKYMKIEM